MSLSIFSGKYSTSHSKKWNYQAKAGNRFDSPSDSLRELKG
jgi:hypothetical protein